MSLHQSSEKCNILFPDIRKQPKTFLESLKRQIEGTELTTTRGSYTCTYEHNGNILRGPRDYPLKTFRYM